MKLLTLLIVPAAGAALLLGGPGPGAPGPSAYAPRPGPAGDAAVADTDARPSTVAAPFAAERRTPAAVAVDGTGPTGDVAAAAPLPLPEPVPLDEIIDEVAPRVLARYALYQTPIDGMYAAWYAGTELEDLARLRFDGGLVASVLDRGDGRRGEALRALAPQRASLDAETAWLDKELGRRVSLPVGPVSVALSLRSDADLAGTYPTARDRFALRTLLMTEFNELARDAAWGYAALRQVPDDGKPLVLL